MLTTDIFRERVTALYDSQKRMAAAKKWKSGKRAGTIRVPAAVIHFSKDELTHWLWKRVGLNAIPCPYCHQPIDIRSLTPDHIVPRSIGGEFTLANMEPICEDCNHRKGNMTRDGYVQLLGFARANLSAHDYDTLLARLKAAHHGSAQRFHRGQKQQQTPAPPPPARPAKQPTLNYSDISF